VTIDEVSVKSAGEPLLTLNGSASDVDGRLAVLPAYCAVIECEPTASDDVVNDGAATVALPITVVPSRKVSEPLAVPALEVTAAVNVTGEPATPGFEDALSVVVETTCAIVTVFRLDVLANKFPGT